MLVCESLYDLVSPISQSDGSGECEAWNGILGLEEVGEGGIVDDESVLDGTTEMSQILIQKQSAERHEHYM